MKHLQFNLRYFLLMLFVLFIEIAIALFVRDNFVRPYVGDIIAIWFVYYFLRAFLKIKPIYLAIFTLIFSFIIEIGQYFKLIHLIGLEKYQWVKIVFGTSFSWLDLLCYIIGFLFLFLLDKDLRKKH